MREARNTTETIQYTLVKVPIKELIKQDFNVSISKDEEIDKEYLIAQGDSLLFDQIERLRGKFSSHIGEIILVVAKKNPKQEKDLIHILDKGFIYNGVHYSRFGKSASQGKDGITAFVCDSIFDELYMITQMDIEIEECVISKYEAQRCLPFSSCTLIKDYMPNIVIIGEYEKILQNQLIKYVVEKKKEFDTVATRMLQIIRKSDKLNTVTDLRIFKKYTIENIPPQKTEYISRHILSDPYTDNLFIDFLPVTTEYLHFTVESPNNQNNIEQQNILNALKLNGCNNCSVYNAYISRDYDYFWFR